MTGRWGPSVLALLVDALLPAEAPPDGGARHPSASERGVDRDGIELVATLPARESAEFAPLLRSLDGRFASLLLTGRPVRFSSLAPKEREACLRGWARSRLAVQRRGFHAVKRRAAGPCYAPAAGADDHPLGGRIHYEPPPLPEVVADPFAGHGPIVPGADVEERTDVRAVGSGAGGSVVADRLTGAGYRVVLLWAGAWILGLRYPRTERGAHEQLFFGRGAVTNTTHPIGLLAGEAVGGGTVINGMTCLPPRPEARAAWAREGGMVGVDGPAFDAAYRAVAARLEVSTAESEVTASNDALRRGCAALGYRQGLDWELIARNAVGCRSRCGFRTFGGPYGARRSTLTTFRAAGAPRIASLHTPRIEVGDGSGPISEAALERFTGEVLARGIRENAIALFSAHPMGSARAGTDPRTSTCRPTGELHGVDGLWVADGGLRPTAPGANPMISLLAVAVLTAEALLARWGGPTAG